MFLYLILYLILLPNRAGAELPYPWLTESTEETLARRFPPPKGYTALPAAEGSFARWLRHLPLYPGCPPVHLYNGAEKGNQSVHVAVVRLDVPGGDLQQCADAVIRLRAEYLWAAGREDEIAFHFTSGDLVRWSDWREGVRPQVTGNKVRLTRSAAARRDYANFQNYLQMIFTYAGTASLAGELVPVPDPATVEVGDVFIKGGHPGHAVIVVDVAENKFGERIMLLAQSYMPAQELHILRHPSSRELPWYDARSSGGLVTPEWVFRYDDLKRWKQP